MLHAAARVVQEMGKSRAAAYALGVRDIDEGSQLHVYAENVEVLDSDPHDGSQSEGKLLTILLYTRVSTQITWVEFLFNFYF